MTIIRESFTAQSTGMRPTYHMITDQVKEIVSKSGVKLGICVVSTHHTTCSVMTQECSFDKTYTGLEYLQQDLTDIFENIIPTCRKEGQYMHPGPEHIEAARGRDELACWSLNTDAHLRSVIMGRSQSIPLIDGEMALGEFGVIYFADFDQVRARERTVRVQIVGDC